MLIDVLSSVLFLAGYLRLVDCKASRKSLAYRSPPHSAACRKKPMYSIDWVNLMTSKDSVLINGLELSSYQRLTQNDPPPKSVVRWSLFVRFTFEPCASDFIVGLAHFSTGHSHALHTLLMTRSKFSTFVEA